MAVVEAVEGCDLTKPLLGVEEDSRYWWEEGQNVAAVPGHHSFEAGLVVKLAVSSNSTDQEVN